MTYFSDRETGEVPRTGTELTSTAWRGIAALIQTRIENGSFGAQYPESCPDGSVSCGTNFRSFWDALYSTFWGDGWVAAQPLVPMRHDQWNYDFMSVGYLLALPATALLFVGGARALREAFRGEDPRQRAAWWFLLTLIYLMGYALLSLTVELPYFGQARASYALALISPIAVLFALGADACDGALGRRGWHRARLAARAWLVACLVVLYLGFAA